MAIFQIDERFYIPSEAAFNLMHAIKSQACAGCPISVGGEPPDPEWKLSICSSPFEITDGITFGDLGVVEADEVVLNAAAGPDYCEGGIEGPINDPVWSLPGLVIDQQIITGSGGETAYGAAIYADYGDGNLLLGLAQFPVPLGDGSPGTIFKISGKLLLCSCLPAEEE